MIARIAITGSGTLAPLEAHLRVACAQAGMHPAIHVGGFRQWAQELLSEDSALNEFSPDVIVLALAGGDLFPKHINDPDADADALSQERKSGLGQIEMLLDAVARRQPATSIILHTFSAPDRSPFGIADLKRRFGQRSRVNTLNDQLVDLAATARTCCSSIKSVWRGVTVRRAFATTGYSNGFQPWRIVSAGARERA